MADVYWPFEDYGFETLSGYRRGGYHPVHIGQLFKDNQYLVVYKIGSGSFSTVWLAKDQLAE